MKTSSASLRLCAPLVLFALAVPIAHSALAVSTDKSFHVTFPRGWKEKTPRKGYLLQLVPPDGKGGFSIQLPPAGMTTDKKARESLQVLARKVGRRFRIKFSDIKKLETPHPGRMYFMEGPLKGRTYLIGLHHIGKKWYRVDVLSKKALDNANYILSSLRPGAPKKRKRRVEFVSPANGWFTVRAPRGWYAAGTSDIGEVLLESSSGDLMSITYDPTLAKKQQVGPKLSALADELADKWGVEFSEKRIFAFAGRDFIFKGGHVPGQMVDSAMIGYYKAETAFLKVTILAKSTRPISLVDKILTTLRLKGEEERGPQDAPAKKREQKKISQNPFAKIKGPTSPQTSEGPAWLLMIGMALVLILGVGAFAIFEWAKGKPRK